MKKVSNVLTRVFLGPIHQKKLFRIVLLLGTVLTGCMQLEVEEDADETTADFQEQKEATAVTDTGELRWPDGYSPSADGLGVHIDCVAPNRDAYIAANTSASLEEGEVDVIARAHVILFVFDRSGSMGAQWDHRSKWQAAADIMLESVSMFQSYVTAGAIFYPSDSSCDVRPIEHERQIALMDASLFLAQWESRTTSYGPDGGTPMNEAFVRADMAIARACQQGLMEKPLRVVVLTDGEPNCSLDMNLLTAFPAKWANHGVRTYVVGLPGYGAETLLRNIAEAGDTLAELVERGVSEDGVMDAGTTDDLSDYLIITID